MLWRWVTLIVDAVVASFEAVVFFVFFGEWMALWSSSLWMSFVDNQQLKMLIWASSRVVSVMLQSHGDLLQSSGLFPHLRLWFNGTPSQKWVNAITTFLKSFVKQNKKHRSTNVLGYKVVRFRIFGRRCLGCSPLKLWLDFFSVTLLAHWMFVLNSISVQIIIIIII